MVLSVILMDLFKELTSWSPVFVQQYRVSAGFCDFDGSAEPGGAPADNDCVIDLHAVPLFREQTRICPSHQNPVSLLLRAPQLREQL